MFCWSASREWLGANCWSSVILIGCADAGVVPDSGYQYAGGSVCSDCTIPSFEKASAKNVRHPRGTAEQDHEEPLNKAQPRPRTDGVGHCSRLEEINLWQNRQFRRSALRESTRRKR